MSFLGRFRTGASISTTSVTSAPRRDFNAPTQTPLEKLLAAESGPLRQDGSDKFFGLENFGSTCYANSVIQCLYYSAPFREQIVSFPNRAPIESHNRPASALRPLLKNKLVAPAVNVPANTRVDETKDSPEYKKKQALAAGPLITMDYENAKHYNMEESLFSSLKDIFEAVIAHESRSGIVSPQKLLEILRRDNEMFRQPMHQDAHEFLNILLNDVSDRVEKYVKQTKEGEKMNGRGPIQPTKTGANTLANALTPIITSMSGSGTASSASLSDRWVHELFEGTLTSETRCLTCENVSQRDEPFLDLSVDLAQNTSVTACLRKFSEEEMLCERNKFHCDKCSGLQEAEKRMKVKRLPRILALHLKRFKYTEDFNRLHKLFHRVVYPYYLRLFNTTDDAEDPDRLYELYAVVVHIGGGPYHGHYVSIIKTPDRGWLLFDDEMVEPVDKSYVCNFFGGEGNLASAYVLFYQETTFEAMQKELESENAASTAAAAMAAGRTAEMAKEAASPLSPKANGSMNGIYSSHEALTPTAESAPSPFHNLSRIATAPAPLAGITRMASATSFDTPLQHTPTSPNFPSGSGVRSPIQQRRDQLHQKIDDRRDDAFARLEARHAAIDEGKQARKDEKDSKRDQKAREKERKREEKEAEKARKKELEEAEKRKRKDYDNQRRELERRQDEQLRAAIEASKASKLQEDNSRASTASRDAASSSGAATSWHHSDQGNHQMSAGNGQPVSGGHSTPGQAAVNQQVRMTTSPSNASLSGISSQYSSTTGPPPSLGTPTRNSGMLGRLRKSSISVKNKSKSDQSYREADTAVAERDRDREAEKARESFSQDNGGNRPQVSTAQLRNRPLPPEPQDSRSPQNANASMAQGQAGYSQQQHTLPQRPFSPPTTQSTQPPRQPSSNQPLNQQQSPQQQPRSNNNIPPPLPPPPSDLKQYQSQIQAHLHQSTSSYNQQQNNPAASPNNNNFTPSPIQRRTTTGDMNSNTNGHANFNPRLHPPVVAASSTPQPQKEKEKEKGFRFGLGRKKSTIYGS